jgi:WD40-like Beta Propeller Repeat
MTRRAHERTRAALHDATAPGEGQAEERGWQVVREAFAEREPGSRPTRRVPRGLVAGAVAAAVAAFALSPAGAEVGEWIGDAFESGEDDARPVLGSLPAPGAILTESGDGAWIVRDDGSRRRLGDYDLATWSPNGLFVGVARGRELLAVTPQGEVRWSLFAPRAIDSLDWSSDDGFRLAYVAGRELWTVAGDGQGAAVFRDTVGSRAVAWRPESTADLAIHELAFVDARDRVTLADTDSGRVLWRSSPVPARVESLQWSDDGQRLLVEADGFALVLDENGNSLFKGPIATGVGAAAIAPDGERVAIVRPAREGGAELALVPAAPETGRERVLYPRSPKAGAVGFAEPTFSPDGEWIVLPWPRVDQWLFVPVEGGRPFATAEVSSQLDGDQRGAGSFPHVAGWCC